MPFVWVFVGGMFVLWAQAVRRIAREVRDQRRRDEVKAMEAALDGKFEDLRQAARAVPPPPANPTVFEQPPIGRLERGNHWGVPDRGVRH